jgi:hypothetical protein
MSIQPPEKSEFRSTKSETNPKHEIANNKQGPNHKHQAPNQSLSSSWSLTENARTCRKAGFMFFVRTSFRIWFLAFGACLWFGACDLELAYGWPASGVWNI